MVHPGAPFPDAPAGRTEVSSSTRWRARVAGLLPRRSGWRMRTRALGPRWQPFVTDAVAAEDRYLAAVRRVERGPLKDRLEAIGVDVATAVEETWRVAAAGQDLTDARDAIDVATIIAELGLAERTGGAGADARRRQLDIAKRIDQRLAATEQRLTDLDARLDEVVTRALELGATQQTDALALIGTTVDDVVGELQALASSLDEVPATPTDVASPRPPVEPPEQAEPDEEPLDTAPVAPPYEGPMPDDPDPDPLERPSLDEPRGP